MHSKPNHDIPLDHLVEQFIESDSQILSNLSLDSSMKIDDTSPKNITDTKFSDKSTKRKVKRVDYVLKLTSNEIERKNPAIVAKKANAPSTYSIKVGADLNAHSKKNKYEIITKPDKYMKYKKDDLKNKKLKNQDIFGNNEKYMLNTQRYERMSYMGSHSVTSKESPEKNMKQSKSSKAFGMGERSASTIMKPHPYPDKPLNMGLGAQISNLKSDSIGAAKYRTNVANDKARGHQRIETWSGNLSNNRKSSTIISKNRQSVQSNASNKHTGGYKAYLTNKRGSNHTRKMTSMDPEINEKQITKNLGSSKSASKLSKISYKKDNINSTQESKRLSGNYKLTEKYLNKPLDRKVFKTIDTPTGFDGTHSLRTSGALTSRPNKQSVLHSEMANPDKASVDREGLSNDKKHTSRVATATKARAKNRSENKDSSVSSGKVSTKLATSLSKSRVKDNTSQTKHKKKKSVMIPTRSTKALYSSKAEYAQHQNRIGSALNIMKPSYSAAAINNTSGTRSTAKIEPKIKYPTYEKLKNDSSYHKNKESYKISKSSREPRRLIEFRLRDDDEDNSESINEESKTIKITTKNELDNRFYNHQFVNTKIDIISRLNAAHSQSNLDKLKSKYGQV